MLDKYKNDYLEFYRIFDHDINSNKINHAYMLEIDDSIDINELRRDITKLISNDESINGLIDKDIYQNVKIINTTNMWIKKEEILEIQHDFKNESMNNNYKIYFIEDANKLNKSSANTLLKFLEEPEEKIVAVLFTKNKYSVIETIRSRCRIINMALKKVEKLDIESVHFNIFDILNKYKSKSVPYLYDLLINDELDRDILYKELEQTEKLLSDIIHKIDNVDSKYNYYDLTSLDEYRLCMNKEELIKIIESINNNMELLKVNINIKTLVDKIVYEVYGGE